MSGGGNEAGGCALLVGIIPIALGIYFKSWIFGIVAAAILGIIYDRRFK